MLSSWFESKSRSREILRKEETIKFQRPELVRGMRILMSHFVYILQCSDQTLYVGCTNNLEKRLDQHNNSKSGAHYTKLRRPVVLKHKEEFETLKEARSRESEIKSWRREKKLALIT